MQGNTLVKLLIAAAIALFIWKKGLPWLNEQQLAKTASSTTSKGANCVFAARSASDFWGSNLRSFANPPYDTQAWDEFKSHVDDRISRAGEKCSCNDEACTRAKEALDELRKLTGEMDSAIRSGSPPPSDAVRRQERIDNALDLARDAAK